MKIIDDRIWAKVKSKDWDNEFIAGFNNKKDLEDYINDPLSQNKDIQVLRKAKIENKDYYTYYEEMKCWLLNRLKLWEHGKEK
jgi:hypothetical protein